MSAYPKSVPWVNDDDFTTIPFGGDEAHGASTGFDDADTDPQDNGSDDAERLAELEAIEIEREAQRSMRVIREAINESKARLRAAAPHCRCEVNFVMSGSDYDNGDRFDVWLFGPDSDSQEDDTFRGVGNLAGRSVAEALAAAELEVLMKASVPFVKAGRAAKGATTA